MGFEPHTLLFSQGVRNDLTAFDAETPQELTDATNFTYTKKGSLRTRPGLVSNDAVIVETSTIGGPVTYPGTLLSAATSGMTRAGLEPHFNQLLACWQGVAFVRTADTYPSSSNVWRKVGPFWSTSKSKSAVLGNPLYRDDFISVNAPPTQIGLGLVNVPISSNISTSLGYISDRYIELFDSQSLANFDTYSRSNSCIASNTGLDIILYPKADGSIRYHVCDPTTITGSGTEVTVAAAGSVDVSAASTTSAQSCWIVSGAVANEFYFAYQGSVAGTATVGRILVGTGVTATLNLVGLGNLGNAGVALAHNRAVIGSSSQLVLGYYNFTGNIYQTKVLNVVSTSSITDSGINGNHGSVTTAIYPRHTVSSLSTTSILANFTASNSSLLFSTRTYALAATTLIYTIFQTNLAAPTVPQRAWLPLFPAIQLAGRIVIGVYNTVSTSTLRPAQWEVMDITALVQSSGSPFVIASSQPNEVFSTAPVNPFVDSINGFIKFGTIDGITFDIGGPLTAGPIINKLALVPTRGVAINNVTMLSNSLPYIYDGNQIYPASFIQGSPIIASTGFTGVGGNFAVGTYSFKAIWEGRAANGQVYRSRESNTITFAAAAATSKIDILVEVPQSISRFVTNGTIVIKLYSTGPSGGGNFCLQPVGAGNGVFVTNIPVTNGVPNTGSVTLTLGTSIFLGAQTNTEIIYTQGGAMEDDPPDSADRGLTVAAGRVWAASANRVYASKIIDNRFVPTFNLVTGKLYIDIPSSIGSIIGLGNLNDKVAVIGTNGTAFIYGNGFDNVGNGVGWNVEVTSERTGIGNYVNLNYVPGPRSVCSIPNVGVVFQIANTPYLMGFGGAVQAIGRPFQDLGDTNIYEISYIDAGRDGTSTIEHGPKIILNNGNFKIMDVESGRWSLWTLPSNSLTNYTASIGGTIYRQDASFVGAFTSLSATDYGGPVLVSLTTGNISVSGAIEGASNFSWGRLRSVKLLYNILNESGFMNSITFTYQVTPDKTPGVTSALCNKTITRTGAQTANWPYSNLEDVRMTKQRCSTFVFSLIVDATDQIEIAGIEFWSWVSPDTSPARSRS